MPIMVWDQSLDIGVHDMNREHQDILNAMNEIYDAAQAGQRGAGIMAKVDRLGQVTAKHFRDEEAFMARTKYPDLENHKRMHAKLLRDFAEHRAATEAAGGAPSNAFFQFLRLWLAAHIKCIDLKYAVHSQTQHGPRSA
ncbi:hemerythrin family protein [Terricaulis sp.]|uniref:bacteriohemerythrin n=1 Tax=Terricaulis sp. TaxID=2768686 RepID=UPI002AC3DB57|nr:hemerythrin family protein [Terricaulis sp.]MDZ4691695.1 hemerythrin family protein [Terricaulis sp.]